MYERAKKKKPVQKTCMYSAMTFIITHSCLLNLRSNDVEYFVEHTFNFLILNIQINVMFMLLNKS